MVLRADLCFENARGLTLDAELFIVGTQAARADIDLFGSPINHDGCLLDIWLPNTIGLMLGMADVVTKQRSLAAYLTLGHGHSPFRIGPPGPQDLR